MTLLSPTFIFIFLPLVLSIYAVVSKFKKPDLLPVIGSLFYVSININNPLSVIYFFSMCAVVMISIALYKKYKKKYILLSCQILAGIVMLTLIMTKLFGKGRTVGQVGIVVCFMAIISMCSDILSNKGRIPETSWDAITYVTFFPVMFVGPIIRYCDFVEKLDNLNFNLNNFSKGAIISLKGSIKCMAVSAVIFQATAEVTQTAGNNLSFIIAFLCALANSIAIYCLLSGYSDVARGIAMMLGIIIEDDFANPFTNVTPSDYVRKFFTSLLTFIKNYISRPIMAKFGLGKFGKTISSIACGAFFAMMFSGTIDAFLILLPITYINMYFVLYRGDVEVKKNRFLNVLFCILTFIFMAAVWKVINLRTFATMGDFFRTIGSNPPFLITKYTKYAISNTKYFILPIVGGLLSWFTTKVESYFDVEADKETMKMTVSKYACAILLVFSFLWSIIFILPQFPILANSAFGFWFV